MSIVRAYHFVGPTLRDGRPVPADGEWLVHEGPVVWCKSGLYASRHPFAAMIDAPGTTLCLVDCDDVVQESADKLVCLRRKIVRRIDATDLLKEFARWCASQVVHLWDAPEVVRTFLRTGDPSLRAAAFAAANAIVYAGKADTYAAYAAATAAADASRCAATYVAAYYAAGASRCAVAYATADDSAYAAQRQRFAEMVDEALSHIDAQEVMP